MKSLLNWLRRLFSASDKQIAALTDKFISIENQLKEINTDVKKLVAIIEPIAKGPSDAPH
jgi:hypothetical protein